MKHSTLFSSELNVEIEKAACDFLNRQSSEFSQGASKSPRAVGDIAQSIISDHFEAIAPKGLIASYSNSFARRAMADLAFEDNEKHYYVVDVKTHRTSTAFNMPNLTSVERLARFYEDDKNYFVVMMLAYDVDGSSVRFSRVHFVPIEFLDWECLTLGALGWGQIQIANSNKISVRHGYSRRSWMLEMCDLLLEFYPKEISKIGRRISHFEKVKSDWIARSE